eukprot:CAMPEP_0116055090 /NCGR_PEP_ID=MMETSP0322-20121206/3194_1 /TAXON_ID=163516 /ORGANISM="Leptocylindrus danicus var. apora, Strain B651" /LENGTH=362 /DNA_ID=CAMNT_0003538615 /DNA_START=187 /DNA_END=1272 /DNA_ORIENTATION=+
MSLGENLSGIPDATLSTKPTLILHIGPAKTGTSSIQCLFQSQTGEEMLAKYNYVYLGKFQKNLCGPGSDNERFYKYAHIFGVVLYLKNKYDGVSLDMSKKSVSHLMSLLQHANHENKNVIISAEELVLLSRARQASWDGLISILSDFDVRVIVFHRPYFEWLLSNYHFYNRFEKKNIPWPERLRSFDEYINEEKDALSYISPMNAYKVFEEQFPGKVKVFEMQGNGLVSRFLCSLPSASKSCSYAEIDDALKRAKVNGSGYRFEHNRIIGWAFWKNLVTSCTSYESMANALDSYLKEENTSLSNLPHKCLDESLAGVIWQETIGQRRYLYGRDATIEEELKKKFDGFVNEGRFCNLDLESVM